MNTKKWKRTSEENESVKRQKNRRGFNDNGGQKRNNRESEDSMEEELEERKRQKRNKKRRDTGRNKETCRRETIKGDIHPERTIEHHRTVCRRN